MERLIVIPAAGTGSRLRADLPKLLVPVNGRPMIEHLLALYGGVAERVLLVVAPGALPAVQASLEHHGDRVSYVVQAEPTGMLDAILLARDAVAAFHPRRVLITWCDQVAIRPETVTAIVAAARANPEPALVLPTCRSDSPYVHLERDEQGKIVRVFHRREGDTMPATGESDAGVFDLSRECYLRYLSEYAERPHIGARTGERNFVPFVAFVSARAGVVAVPCREREEAIGINTPDELAMLEAHLGARGPA